VEGANVTDCLRGADGQPVGAGQSCQAGTLSILVAKKVGVTMDFFNGL